MAGKLVTFEQGSDAWLAWRLKRVTSSEAPVLMGHSPYQTQHGLWLLKTGRAVPPPPHPGMLRGHKFEPEARAFREAETFIASPPTCFEAEIEGTPLGSSLDGFADLSGGRYLIREIKAPNNSDHELALAGYVPKKYRDQLGHQALVVTDALGIELSALEMEYVSYRPGHPKGELVTVPVVPDEAHVRQVLAACKAYWEHIANDTPPTTNRFSDAAWLWRLANDAMAEAKAMEGEARKGLIAAMPEGHSRHEGNGVLLSQSTKAGSTAPAKVLETLVERQLVDKAVIDELLEATRGKETTQWRVTAKAEDPVPPATELAELEKPEGSGAAWAW